MKKVIALLVAAATFAFGQNPAPTVLGPGEEIRVVEVKQGDALSIQRTLGAVFPGVSVNNRMLIVRGQPAVVTMIEEAIKKLDVPAPTGPENRPAANVELVVQLLYGSAQQEASSIPADLEPTVRQLRALFPYKSYRIVDTQVFHIRDGQEAQNEGPLPGGSRFFFFVRPSVALGEPGKRQVRLQFLRLDITMRTAPDKTENARISTDLDAREGQKTVVGKANVTNTEDAIILVVTPKVIE